MADQGMRRWVAEPGFDGANAFDSDLAGCLIGKTLLVGLTHRDHDGALVSRDQVFGRVVDASPSDGIRIRRPDGTDFWLPADTRGIRPAEPGIYSNRATGEVVEDPDYLVSWTHTMAPPESS